MTEPVNDPEYDKRMHELLYSNDGRVEQCERIIRLEGLVLKAISSYLALVWIVNEHAGCERMEPSSPATIRFWELQQQARDLEVPNA